MVIAYFDHYPEMAVARLRSASLLPGTAPGATPFCSPYPTIAQVKAAAVAGNEEAASIAHMSCIEFKASPPRSRC